MIEYRYTLRRGGWLGDGQLCWVMLNPSTADDLVDDPTIRRVIRFTRDAGYSDLVVVNLFAARTTRPVHLTEMADPIGPDNVDAIRRAMRESQGVVFAWGAWVQANQQRVPSIPDVFGMAWASGRVAQCLGVTAGGEPRHPLYVRADQPLVPYGSAVPA